MVFGDFGSALVKFDDVNQKSINITIKDLNLKVRRQPF